MSAVQRLERSDNTGFSTSRIEWLTLKGFDDQRTLSGLIMISILTPGFSPLEPWVFYITNRVVNPERV